MCGFKSWEARVEYHDKARSREAQHGSHGNFQRFTKRGHWAKRYMNSFYPSKFLVEDMGPKEVFSFAVRNAVYPKDIGERRLGSSSSQDLSMI